MGKKNKKDNIILRSYPKAIFLYPLFIVTTGAWIYQWIANEFGLVLFGLTPEVASTWLSILWLGTLFFCFFVISIEIKLSKLCAAIFALIAFGVVLYFSPIGATVVEFITNAGNLGLALPLLFYISVLSILVIILGGMIVGAHIEYVKIEQNEIWCMKGITGKSKERFPTRSMEINVERPDFLEYWLGTGRITIKIPSLNKFIQLDTVFRAGKKVGDIDTLLSSIAVIPRDVAPVYHP